MADKEIIIDGVNIIDCNDYYVEQETDQVKCDLSGEYCRENKNCFYKQLARKTQECEALKKRNEDNERFYLKQYAKKDSEVLDLTHQLNVKTRECENLKAEEKYLKQCCTKAGEELAKHSFEYDGKEKNLVVQALELNERYEKLKKALEEIEKYCNYKFCDEFGNFTELINKNSIIDIINKAKDGE